jgi:tetratricopeptide (TPR) repeat protein
MTRSPGSRRWPLLFAALLASAAAADIQVGELPPPDSEASAPASDSLAVLEELAGLAYADGDLRAALELYLEIARRHEDPAERSRLLLVASWLAFQLEEPASALRHLEDALYLEPELPFQREIYSPEFQNVYQDALRNALHRRRVRTSELINEAVVEMRAQRHGDARRMLRDALALTPDHPDGLYNLALVDLRTGDDDAALMGFERVLALERGNPEAVSPRLKNQALNNSAVIYFARGAFEEAQTALAEAVALDPMDAGAWFNLGLTRQRLGRADESYDALRRARALAPADVAIARALAIAEIDRGNWIAAVAMLVEANDAHPGDADLRLLLGRAQRGLGNAAGAVESFRAALELDPADRAGIGGTAALLLAETLRGQRDVAGFEEAASRAVTLRGSDGSAWMLLGLARLMAGNSPGGKDALERARELAPERPDVVHNLGTAYMALGDYARAEQAFVDALQLDPANAEAAATLDGLRARQSEPPAGSGRSRDLGAHLVVGDYAALGIRGLRVESVPVGSPAARAGLRPGDLILQAEGRPVQDLAALRRILNERRRTTLLAILRDGRPLEVRVSFD